MVGDEPALNENFFEETKDQFCIKLTTDKGIAGYDKVSQAVGILNEYLGTIHPNYLTYGGLCIVFSQSDKKFMVDYKRFGFDLVMSEAAPPLKNSYDPS